MVVELPAPPVTPAEEATLLAAEVIAEDAELISLATDEATEEV